MAFWDDVVNASEISGIARTAGTRVHASRTEVSAVLLSTGNSASHRELSSCPTTNMLREVPAEFLDLSTYRMLGLAVVLVCRRKRVRRRDLWMPDGFAELMVIFCDEVDDALLPATPSAQSGRGQRYSFPSSVRNSLAMNSVKTLEFNCLKCLYNVTLF